ncbi:unnamed protein product [Leptidea sinapis]|uniref:UBP-type domain-containing protein n=1 Tax=Leptidea sinapis TaxID=189913 RepID=A0A5E4R8U2_9NEOP|nr:unnamed protein product [Leptidea sinapis]
MGDAEYLAAFTQVVLPIAYEYNPELVIVSAGFDAAINDPLGKCNVTPECYGIMTHMLRGLAGGRVVLCLEGGYNITSSSYAMTMCTKALLGDPILRQYDPNITCHPSAVESINDVIQVHSKYWKSLKFQLALPIENVLKEKSEAKADSSLDSAMGRLSLSKCSDGIHCGTDDEDETGEEKEIKKENEVDRGKEDEQPNAGGSGGKQTLVDFLADNMQAIADGEMFAVVPLASCPHLETLYAIPSDVAFRPGAKCEQCDHTLENWVCLHCYVTACGRHINGHMQAHYSATHHPLSLSLADLSVWCYPCDAYVDNPLLYDAKNNAHRCKFGEDMPWCYRYLNIYFYLVYNVFKIFRELHCNNAYLNFNKDGPVIHANNQSVYFYLVLKSYPILTLVILEFTSVIFIELGHYFEFILFIFIVIYIIKSLKKLYLINSVATATL